MLVSVGLMMLDNRAQFVKEVRGVASIIVFPIQYIVNFPVTAGEWMHDNFASRETLLAEVTSLKTQQLLYDTRLQKLASLESENIRLRRLLDSPINTTEKVLIAELLSVDLDPFTSQIVINKGSRHDIFEGQPILDAHGIMGQVTQVGPLTSTAMLITDPNHAIPVIVNRNGLRSIALGTGSADALEIAHLPNNADIQVDDLLVSSGLGGRFPKGFPVATVTKIEQDPGQPFARISAKPAAQLQRSREVLLIWPNIPSDAITIETNAEETAG